MLSSSEFTFLYKMCAFKIRRPGTLTPERYFPVRTNIGSSKSVCFSEHLYRHFEMQGAFVKVYREIVSTILCYINYKHYIVSISLPGVMRNACYHAMLTSNNSTICVRFYRSIICIIIGCGAPSLVCSLNIMNAHVSLVMI